MAYTISTGYTDTHSAKKNLPIADLSFVTDFSSPVVLKNTDSNIKIQLNNKTGSRQLPERIVIERSKVNNVYGEKSPVNPLNQLPVKEGVRLYVQLSDYFKKADDANTAATEYMIPNTASITYTGSVDPLVTPELALSTVLRAAACLFPEGTVTNSQFKEWLYGALVFLDETPHA